MKILICEDNILTVKALTFILTKAGYETVHAADGLDAMNLLGSADFDLVLIDIHLPYHSGLELIRYLRIDLKKETPVIVASAFSDAQTQKQAYELGINEYILKPIDPAGLVNKISKLLNK